MTIPWEPHPASNLQFQNPQPEVLTTTLLVCMFLLSNLAADLQHLRQLLHEEKEAAATAQNLLDSSQPHLLPGTNVPLAAASREQVLQQLTVLLGKHAKERARNGELVRRLQQLHAEKVEVMELQRQYMELQDAHFQQARLTRPAVNKLATSICLSVVTGLGAACTVFYVASVGS